MGHCSTVVQQSTLNPKVKGSNPATGAGREKMAEESWLVLDQQCMLSCPFLAHIHNTSFFSQFTNEHNKPEFLCLAGLSSLV